MPLMAFYWPVRAFRKRSKELHPSPIRANRSRIGFKWQFDQAKYNYVILLSKVPSSLPSGQYLNFSPLSALQKNNINRQSMIHKLQFIIGSLFFSDSNRDFDYYLLEVQNHYSFNSQFEPTIIRDQIICSSTCTHLHTEVTVSLHICSADIVTRDK